MDLSIIITLLVWAAALAILWWVLNSLPIPPPFRWVINVIVAVLALYALFSIFGGGAGIGLRHRIC